MLKEMKVNKHLKPGQKGTRRLLNQYGDKLLCVRYRYDEKRQVKIKTVEIIVSETYCTAPLPYRDCDIVDVVVPFTKTMLRDRLKAAGGRWNPDEKLWRVSFGAIKGDFELIQRIL